jgi:hypothetical protein
MWIVGAGLAGAVLLIAAAGYLVGWQAGSAPSFESPQAVADRAAELGMPCANLTLVREPKTAAQQGRCKAGSEFVVISTFTDDADIEKQWASMTDIPGIGLAVGPNWTIVSDDDGGYARKIADLLDAEYRTS